MPEKPEEKLLAGAKALEDAEKELVEKSEKKEALKKGEGRKPVNRKGTDSDLDSLNPPGYTPDEVDKTSDSKKESSGDGDSDRKIADVLMDFVMEEEPELLVDQFQQPHVLWRNVPVPLTARFDSHLRVLFEDRTKRTVGKNTVTQVRESLESRARVEDNERELHTRAAWLEETETLYYWLGPGRIARVDRNGWSVVSEAPVLFRVVRNLLELPDPISGGDFDVFSRWINLARDQDKRMFITWNVTAIHPKIPRPMFEPSGEMGAGKSTASRVPKRLLDPTRPETVRMDTREFLQKAAHAYIVVLDNVNSLSEAAVDMLCRLVTGEADSKRELYSVDEDFIYELSRAIILNGINSPTDRADARDRTLPMELQRIVNFRTEADIWNEFKEAHPALLGAIFDTFSKALRIKESLPETPHARLADWSRYAACVYEAMGWGVDQFSKDLDGVIKMQNQGSLEGSAVAQVILKFMSTRSEWEGLSTDLFAKLEVLAEEMSIDIKREKSWPKAPSWLWRRIKEVKPLLTALSIQAENDRTSEGSFIFLRRTDRKGEGSGSTPGDSSESVPGGPGGSSPFGGSSSEMLPWLLPSSTSDSHAGSDSNVGNVSISGHNAGTYPRSIQENEGKTAQESGKRAVESGENTQKRKPSANAAIPAIAAIEDESAPERTGGVSHEDALDLIEQMRARREQANRTMSPEESE